MTQNEQELQLLQKLEKAATNSLSKSGELPRIKAYIAATLFSEILSREKPVDSRFQAAGSPSSDEIETVLRILEAYKLNSTLKVLELELGLSGDFSSAERNSAHETSESMSISPNRYTNVKTESDSLHNDLHASDDFDYAAARAVSEIPAEPHIESAETAALDAINDEKLAETEGNLDDLAEFDDLEDLDFADGLPSKFKGDEKDTAPEARQAVDNLDDLDDFGNFDDLDFGDAQAASAPSEGAEKDENKSKSPDKEPANTEAEQPTKTTSPDDFDDLEDLDFDNQPPSVRKDTKEEAAGQSAQEEIDDLDNFDDLDPDFGASAGKSQEETKPKSGEQPPKLADLDDLDNFDDLEDLDFDLQKPAKNQASEKKNPTDIDDLQDFGDFGDFEDLEEPKPQKNEKQTQQFDDLDNFDDLEDFGFPGEEKPEKKGIDTDLDNFDGLDDLDFGFDKQPALSGKKNVFDFEDFEDL